MAAESGTPVHGRPTDPTELPPELPTEPTLQELLAADHQFGVILDGLQAILDAQFQALGILSETVELASDGALDPEWLVALARQTALSTLRVQLMGARHELHGAMTTLALARREIHPLRPRRRPP